MQYTIVVENTEVANIYVKVKGKENDLLLTVITECHVRTKGVFDRDNLIDRMFRNGFESEKTIAEHTVKLKNKIREWLVIGKNSTVTVTSSRWRYLKDILKYITFDDDSYYMGVNQDSSIVARNVFLL